MSEVPNICHGRFGEVVRILTCCARVRGFNPGSVEIFVCLNMSLLLGLDLRIRDKYGSLTRNMLLMKSVTTLNMTYTQNTHRFRGFKLTFVCLKFSLTEEMTYEIDI
jgi:hypothetical protein